MKLTIMLFRSQGILYLGSWSTFSKKHVSEAGGLAGAFDEAIEPGAAPAPAAQLLGFRVKGLEEGSMDPRNAQF